MTIEMMFVRSLECTLLNCYPEHEVEVLVQYAFVVGTKFFVSFLVVGKIIAADSYHNFLYSATATELKVYFFLKSSHQQLGYRYRLALSYPTHL